MIFGGGVFEIQLGLKEVIKVGPPTKKSVPIRKRRLSLPCEDAAAKGFFANQKEDLNRYQIC